MMVSNCPRCQIVRGVKLSSLHGRCQIVLFCMMVSNCPRCQIVRGVKLSSLHGRCQIVLGVKLSAVSNCPITTFKDGVVALCACHCIGCHLKQLKVDGSAGLEQTGHFQPLLNQTTNH